jgi:hypothetical protein
MPIGTVKQLCTPSSDVNSGSVVDQVAQLEHFEDLRKDGAEFFRRNHFTDGLKRLVERGFDRLAGNSREGAFYLTQAMGGGKTHSLLAFGLLAAEPALRRQVYPQSQAGREFGPAKVVIFSGLQSPDNLLWGHVAEARGMSDVMAPFWKNGPKVPGVNEWAALLGDDPVLILLDELPSYLRVTQGQAVGNTTLGELTILGLERLFNALERCPRACVVVANLKDDIYLEGSTQLKTLLESLSKHADRNAEPITPVQQNTSEVFEIVRKRLFDKLPPPDKIDEIAQAYVSSLQKAKRVDTIPTTPETFIERIRETYPFHPSIRDIVARFAENRGYQKTRALIRILRLAVKSALASDGSAFLVGLQHLDFNDQATQEELRKINPYYVNAISRDIASRGDALAERVDKLDGNGTASAVAKVLLMSSLSTAETPLRGLTDGELIEALVDPLLEVSEIKSALGRLQGQAWYLFQGVDQRIFFGQNANVTAEITEIAQNIAEELVDQSLRDKLKEVFKPRTGHLYSEKMAVLPALDQIELDDDRPTLIILERPADRLPADFDEWWKKQDAQNRVLVLTADPNAVTTLRGNARRARAIGLVKKRIKEQHGEHAPQMEELRAVESREEMGYTSALRETFKTIVFPIGKTLRKFDDFRMEFDSNDYQGEQQIIDTLTARSKYVPSERFEQEFEKLRLDAEDILFDADAVQPGSLKRNAAVRSGWYWLSRGGLEHLIKTACQRGHWRENQGLVAKKWERRTKVEARLDEFAPNPLDTGRFFINVTPEDADIVYVSESGPPDPTKDKHVDGRVYETDAPVVWFLAVDSSGKNLTGPATEWPAPIRVKPDIRRVASGYRVRFNVCPRSATVHVTFDGSDPSNAPALSKLEVDAPQGAKQLRVIAKVGSQACPEEVASLATGMDDGHGGAKPARAPLKPDVPAALTSRTEPKDTGLAFKALDMLAKTTGTVVYGGAIELSGGRSEGDYLTLRIGRDVGIEGADLAPLVKTLVEQLKADQPVLKLRLDSVNFPSGRELSAFCDMLGEDFERVSWKQE